MSPRMSTKERVDATRDRIEQIFNQAKDSLKALDSLQKEGLSMAKSYVKIPHIPFDKSSFSKENLTNTLKKLGFATKSDVKELNDKIDDLASELRSQISKLSKKKPD